MRGGELQIKKRGVFNQLVQNKCLWTALLLFLVTKVHAEDRERLAHLQAERAKLEAAQYQAEVRDIAANSKRAQEAFLLREDQFLSQLKQSMGSGLPTENKENGVLVFISFSMPKDSIQQWLVQAKKINAVVVIRGLVNDSFADTAKVLAPLFKTTGGGVSLDPPAFHRYHINKVPAVVVHQGDEYAVSYGNTTLDYALHQIAESQTTVALDAKAFLVKGEAHV